MIEAVGVVVPAHNEEMLLPACLRALRRAAGIVSMPVHLLVVADACTDQTIAAARAGGARVTGIRARNVGAARAAGMAELLRLTAYTRPAAVWLATTDADSVVPPHWLRRQLRYASQGWDVVLGTVSVADSLQLLPLLPADARRAVDLGSWGGFPGIVLAIASWLQFDLVEVSGTNQ